MTIKSNLDLCISSWIHWLAYWWHLPVSQVFSSSCPFVILSHHLLYSANNFFLGPFIIKSEKSSEKEMWAKNEEHFLFSIVSYISFLVFNVFSSFSFSLSLSDAKWTEYERKAFSIWLLFIFVQLLFPLFFLSSSHFFHPIRYCLISTHLPASKSCLVFLPYPTIPTLSSIICLWCYLSFCHTFLSLFSFTL